MIGMPLAQQRTVSGFVENYGVRSCIDTSLKGTPG